MRSKLQSESPDTGESGEAYDVEIEAKQVLSKLPFAFEWKILVFKSVN